MAESMTMTEAQKVLGRELKPSTLAHIIIKTKMNSRAWCFCDICDYKDKCEYYRKVVVCPYLKIEKKIVMRKFYICNVTPEANTIFVFGSNTEGRHGAE